MLDFKTDDIQTFDWTKAVRLSGMVMAQSAWANSILKVDPLNMEFVCRHNSGGKIWIY